MIVPRVARPAQDESIYSWLYYLAKINGLSLPVFLATYIFGSDAMPTGFQFEHLKQDGFGIPLAHFFRCLPTALFTSFMAFIRSTTLYNAIEPVSSQAELAAILQRLDTASPMMEQNAAQAKKPCYCPECIKDDFAKIGRSYIHRAHQVEGVTVCHRHGCTLLKSKGIDIFQPTISLANEWMPVTKQPPRNALAYARFVFELLQSGLQFCGNNSELLCTTAFNALEENRYISFIGNTETLPTFFKLAHCDMGYIPFRMSPAEWYAFSGVYTPGGLSRLLFLFGSVNELRDAFLQVTNKRRLDQDAAFHIVLRLLVDNEYVCTRPVFKSGKGEYKVGLKHLSCGAVHLYSIDDFLHGARCSCIKHLKDCAFVNEVQRLSNHACIVSRQPNGSYAVNCIARDAIRGAISMPQEMILQELKRPTLSPYFRIQRGPRPLYSYRAHASATGIA